MAQGLKRAVTLLARGGTILAAASAYAEQSDDDCGGKTEHADQYISADGIRKQEGAVYGIHLVYADDPVHIHERQYEHQPDNSGRCSQFRKLFALMITDKYVFSASDLI